MSGGRPSKYKPEFCQMYIEHAKKGGSKESFGAVAKVDIKTIYNWMDTIPEFFQAVKDGEAELHQFYENLGKGLMVGQLKGNPTTFIWMTKNILKWRDRHDIELGGKDGGAINFSNLSETELAAKVQELIAKAGGTKKK